MDSTTIGEEQQRFPERNVDVTEDDTSLWNWAQNSRVGQMTQINKPRNEEELCQLLRESQGRLRVVGSRLSGGFMLTVKPDDVLIDLENMRDVLEHDDTTITVAAGISLNELFAFLASKGRMLAASPGVIAVQRLAGAMATGTHGQGLYQSSIADDALKIRMALADGTVRDFVKGDPEFPAVQLTMGVLGVVTAVTLRTEPFRVYTCRKIAVSADTLVEDLLRWNKEHLMSKAWWFVDDNLMHVWNADEAIERDRAQWITNGRQELKHKEEGDDTLNKTIDQTLKQMHRDTQLQGKGGKQFKTVTRFRDFTDVTGDIYQVFCRGIAVPQINVEIGIPLAQAPKAIRKIKEWYAKSRPHMHYPIIIRCTGPSAAWLSPSRDEPTCFFGFVVYYADDGSLNSEGVYFLTEVEKLLAEEGGRPHWGKYYDPKLYTWQTIYPHWDDFRALRDKLDPGRRFMNEFLSELLHR